jgi:hypothetical protein
MDILEFLAVVVPVLTGAYLISKWIALADARARIELQKRLAKTKDRSSGDQRGQIAEQPQLGAWVEDLGKMFGFEPELLFDDDMPDEVKRLLPLAKGFIESGGLAKLLSGAQQQQQPTMPGGDGWDRH